ncbi:GGDEF domain-containing protein [Aeromonas hydrophila]|nr:GGDEF domain-containing protein [Aeromonas hydrophila]
MNEGVVEQISKSDGQLFDRLATCQDGNTFFVEFSIATLDDGSQVGEMRDISIRKTMEDELRLLVFRDALTGAFNRRFFFERAEVELARFGRSKNNLCFAIFDIDFFKKINDTYGHGVGDSVLKKFSHFCLDGLRETDTFARYGGEEFVLIMPDTDSSQAMIVLERLCDGWKTEHFSHQGESFNSTVSVGVVQVNDVKPIEHWLDLADQALYRAKLQGRDRIIIAN